MGYSADFFIITKNGCGFTLLDMSVILLISGDISPPRGVRAAMEMQAEAERKKRAQVLESEGNRSSSCWLVCKAAEGPSPILMISGTTSLLRTCAHRSIEKFYHLWQLTLTVNLFLLNV